MDQNEMLQMILNEVKTSNKEVLKRFNGVERRLDGVEKRLESVENKVEGHEKRFDSIENKLDQIEKVVNSHTEILNSFKHDVDFIAQRQTKTDMKVNRIEKLILS